MNELTNLIRDNYDNIIKIVITNPIYKANEDFKIVIEKKQDNGLYFLASIYYETKVRHVSTTNLTEFVMDILEKSYKHVNIFCQDITYEVLINKKGNFKISSTKANVLVEENVSHNRIKNYILKEQTPIDFLIYLGVMNKEGKVLAQKQKKFKQINRFLEFFMDIEHLISEESTIIDIGCGKSYLTFAIYYYLNVIKNKNVKIIGLDLKTDVVEHCNTIAKDLKYSSLEFMAIDIKDFVTEDKKIDLVVSLHACDTATDYCIYNAIKWKAKVIMSVPCCQHEAFSMIKTDKMKEVLKHGILKERFSAMLTDSMRASLMEQFGYKTSIMEFIDMEHTPKNILIRGVYTGNKTSEDKYKELCEMFQCEITLKKLLYQDSISIT